MRIVVGILILLISILIGFLWKLQRQVKDICRQLRFLEKHDSNMIITREMEYGGVGELADLLNDFLDKRKKERKHWLEKEQMIADAYTNLSHDIRTPLTSLNGYFQLLEECQEDADRQRYLGIIQERIGSLKDMLEEMFTFTKLKNESYSIPLSHCCINRILKNTIFSYYENWTAQGIVAHIKITEELLYIEGNAQALRRVIQNVVKNAQDHGQKRISISLQKEKQQAVLTVRNQMADPEQIAIDQVFERFYKADVARSKNSNGLGLSIAKEFILRMHGTVQATVEGEEFCVEIRFPETGLTY